MAQQAPPQETGMGGRIVRIVLYVIAFVVMTFFPGLQTFKMLITERKWSYSPLIYEIAKEGVRKRNEITQRKILAPYQPPSSAKAVSAEEEDHTSNLTVYNLSLMWDSAGKKSLIVNIANPTIWRYFVVKIRVVLDSPRVQREIESPENAAQIQDMLMTTIAAQKVEEVRLPEGKAKLKEEIRRGMNAILAGERIVAVYFDEFFFQ
jgi:flagellar basal body-associated protein FliL